MWVITKGKCDGSCQKIVACNGYNALVLGDNVLSIVTFDRSNGIVPDQSRPVHQFACATISNYGCVIVDDRIITVHSFRAGGKKLEEHECQFVLMGSSPAIAVGISNGLDIDLVYVGTADGCVHCYDVQRNVYLETLRDFDHLKEPAITKIAVIPGGLLVSTDGRVSFVRVHT
jgi:hypothetical protein